MKKLKYFGLHLLFIFSFFSGSLAFAQSANESTVTCGGFSDIGEDIARYCIDFGDSQSAGHVLYYLHGLGGSETKWADSQYGMHMIHYWTTHNISRPTVITITYGPAWLITPQSSSMYSGIYEAFVQRLMPYLEHLYFPQGLSSRRVFGVSMGGHNALQLWARDQGLFERVAAICPAYVEISPFAPLDQFEDYAQARGADPLLALGLSQLFQVFYGTNEEWQKNDILGFLRASRVQSTTPIYISGATDDHYGFYTVDHDLAGNLQADTGATVTWESVSGGHCDLDENSLGSFLSVGW